MYIDTIIVSATASVFILFASFCVNLIDHKYLLGELSLRFYYYFFDTCVVQNRKHLPHFFHLSTVIGYGCALLCLISMIWATSTLTILILTCLYIGFMSKSYNILIGATVLLFPTSLR